MHLKLYVSPTGNDTWSGLLAEPNTEGTDGPLAGLRGARNRLRRLQRPPVLQRANWKPEPLPTQVTVLIRGGRYMLEEPLYLGPEDALPVSYEAYPNEHPIMDAGSRIGGWQVEQANGVTMWVTHLPDVAAGTWYFRSLFVNGARRRRARLPKDGWFFMENIPGGEGAAFHDGSDNFIAREGDILPWKNLSDVEVIALHKWVDEHMPIASFDPATRKVQCTRRSVFSLTGGGFNEVPFAKYYVENVFEALSTPGEWYLDRVSGNLYYVPLPGETPAETEAFAPRLTQFMEIKGDLEHGRHVQSIRFSGLTFQHSDAALPQGGWDPDAVLNDDEEERWPRHVDYASSLQAADNVPGAVEFEAARGCLLENCRLEHVGWYGIAIGDGCEGLTIRNNSLADIGAGGVRMGGSNSGGSLTRRTGYNIVSDNHIHDFGRVFHQGVGIFLKHTFGNVISRNHIHDGFYTGISCGWVWGLMESVSRDNRIEKNHIHHLGFGWLSDMGGIYTLGVQPGTFIRGNYIHDVECAEYGGWGLYLDEGSSHMVVENNICFDTSSDVFFYHYGRENIVRNNIFAFGRDGVVHLGHGTAEVAFTFQNNIVLAREEPLFVVTRTELEDCSIRSDLNLLWSTARPALLCAGEDLASWQGRGLDRHSILADPEFADAEARDFRLKAGSAAFELGFRAIDMADVPGLPDANDQERME